MTLRDDPAPTPISRRLQWHRLAGWLALAVSAAYAAFGTWWWLGRGGYPFGPEGDPHAPLSILGGIPTQAGALGFAVVGALSAIAAGLLIRGVRHPVRRPLATFGAVVGLTAAVLIPDYRILVAVAYAPIFLVAAPFGLP